MATQQPTHFATAFLAATERAGITLTECARALGEYGQGTTVATLSNWRSGKSLPLRTSSRPVVDALEAVLSLAPGTLTSALLEDLGASGDGSLGVGGVGNAPHNHDSDVIRNFAATDESIDWRGEVERTVLEEELRISADFRHVHAKITVLAIIPPGIEQPTLHVSAFWYNDSPPEPGDIGVYKIEGAEAGKTVSEVYPEGTARTTTLLLPQGLTPGSLHRIYYEQGYTSPEPVKAAAQRAFSWPMHFYTSRLTFEGELPPEVLWTLTQTNAQGEMTEKVITQTKLVPIDKTVQASVENISNAVAAYSWD